ncbi:MAG: type secretion system secreted protein Hcp [Solirubrobacterales bacterium]|nr:type secretion system secreted protein Hcp [Solirubrobacterales bacterium]
MSGPKAFTGAVCAGLALLCVPAVAGAEISLQFDGARDSPGGKDITSYSWGVSHQSSSSSGGGGAGKASFQELTVSSLSGLNSPNYANAVATGKVVRKAQMYIGDESMGMAFCMEDVEFTHYDVSGSTGEPGEETIRMQYSKMNQVLFARESILTAVFDLKTSKFTVTTDNPCPARG